MENKILCIVLLEGVFIEECDNENIYLCNSSFKLNSPFPIKYLNNTLKSVIVNKPPVDNMSEPLFIGYENRQNKYWNKIKEFNLELENGFKILYESDDKDIVYSCDSSENKFPICWLSDEIKNLIYNGRTR